MGDSSHHAAEGGGAAAAATPVRIQQEEPVEGDGRAASAPAAAPGLLSELAKVNFQSWAVFARDGDLPWPFIPY